MEPQTLVLVLSIAFLILSLGIHEAAHAWVALLCGDTTARDQGRLTLNPVAHIDPFMTILLPAFLALTTGFIFGGARPVPVDPSRLRKPSLHMAFVALAGPASNLVLAVIFMLAFKALVYPMGMDPETVAPRVMQYGYVFNLVLVAFNLLPIPPLDGSRVMAHFLPRNLRVTYVSLERFGMLFLFLLLFSGAFGAIIGPAVDTMISWLDVITAGDWR